MLDPWVYGVFFGKIMSDLLVFNKPSVSTGKTFAWSFDRRFMSKVEKTESGCWLWLGAKMNNGYGQLVVGSVHWAAHRYSYTELIGEIPPGLDLDHLCRNRACTNPAHLEPVTRSENLFRGNTGKHKRPDICPAGHPYSGDNLYMHPSGRRNCRACARIRAQEKRNG